MRIGVKSNLLKSEINTKFSKKLQDNISLLLHIHLMNN